MSVIRKHLPKIIAGTAVGLLLLGIVLGEPGRVLSYAVVICLSCMGIG